MSTYAISRDLEIPPIAGTCAALQAKCFVKWRKSNCIIKDFIKYILSLFHHSWTKESNILRNKLRKDIKSHYWKNILKFQGIKGQSYHVQHQLLMIALECVPAVARVNNLLITRFFLALPFLPIDILKNISINHFILIFLLGGTLDLNELRIDSGERRHLNKLLIEGLSESPVPYIVGFVEFLTNTIPIIRSSNLLSSSVNSNEDELKERLVDNTLSILKMLLQCFIILIILARKGLTPNITTS
ncbi:hypothetical protein PIROE2DRAFT_2672 [Piromyces sp. E2]|nr:hypothetical protein PIROE2DRAFT_2672 [Piromyces sp. E2]|eukprot:OUM69375.1 hypothetical protein PIROE2DRAFT_2672 [Piromyces sp. E2]